MMRLKKKFLVVGTAGLAVIASVTGAALASSGGAKAPRKPAMSVTKAADTDNIQEGDQTSPDNPSGAAVAILSSKAAAQAKASVKSASPKQANDENPGESENPSDGPGGHEDPPGDVNHEFQGEE